MRVRPLLFAAVAALVGCGAEAPTDKGADAPSAAAAKSDARAIESTGNVIEVQMITDENGNYFEPSRLTARQGDIVRFALVSGVHNASFPAAENPGVAGLPGTGPMLQLPGQTYDVTVDFAPGEYFFQCDPHAALGMTGTLTVTQ